MLLTPDGKKAELESATTDLIRSESEDYPESFFDIISRCQSDPMADQREHPEPSEKKATVEIKPSSSSDQETSKRSSTARVNQEMVAVFRANTAADEKLDKEEEIVPLPGLQDPGSSDLKSDEELLDVITPNQGSSLEDQRSELPGPKPVERSPTPPDEEFLAFVMRAQSDRMEDQRASGSSLEDQSCELPRPKPVERPQTPPDDDFFAFISISLNPMDFDIEEPNSDSMSL